jgi:glycosyl hydrolase family 76
VLLLGAAGSGSARAGDPTTTFAQVGAQAAATLLDTLYAGNGLWNQCGPPGCGLSNQDWGADSLTYALHLRWTSTHSRRIASVLRALIATAPDYGTPCEATPCGWSDVPAWDAIASLREYEVTNDARALARAKAAFAYVEDAKVFALGACPSIRYQQPDGEANRLKTLETDANMVKAALLLYRATRDSRYLESAIRTYASARTYFLDRRVPLYSVYVFDDGSRCTQVPHRFFASVNGDMIWSGYHLAAITGRRAYLDQAVATARAVDRHLSDPDGVFADLQAENDIVEPLVEAMAVLARDGHQRFARAWILRNAAAALSARKPDGTFGRFFDGPPPHATTTEWQTNGGLALEIAAASLEPRGRVSLRNRWTGSRFVPHDVSTLPATLRFTGSGIALIGTLGEHCCEPGHARVFVDGRETFNGIGIWQNKSSSGRTIPDSVLFAWRWPRRGTHTLRFEPGQPNGKEGGAFLHLEGFVVL